MGWFETLSAAIVGGSALGAVVAGFMSNRRGAESKLKDSIIADYEKRVKQLEDDKAAVETERDEALKRVTELENERQLPLTQLTELIVNQSAAQAKSFEAVTVHLARITRSLKTLVTKGQAK